MISPFISQQWLDSNDVDGSSYITPLNYFEIVTPVGKKKPETNDQNDDFGLTWGVPICYNKTLTCNDLHEVNT